MLGFRLDCSLLVNCSIVHSAPTFFFPCLLVLDFRGFTDLLQKNADMPYTCMLLLFVEIISKHTGFLHTPSFTTSLLVISFCDDTFILFYTTYIYSRNEMRSNLTLYHLTKTHAHITRNFCCTSSTQMFVSTRAGFCFLSPY